VVFRWTPATDPDGRVVVRSWDLNNDGRGPDACPIDEDGFPYCNMDGEVVWSFDTPGRYTVSFRVTDDDSTFGVATRTITVGPNPSDYKNSNQFCKAEQAFWGDQFASRYGGGSNAYGKCVSSK